MGAGRNLHEAHDELIAFVRNIFINGTMPCYTRLTKVYGTLILPEEGKAEPPYACVEIDDDSTRIVDDSDTTLTIVLAERVYIFVAEMTSAPDSSVPTALLQALSDLFKGMMTNAVTWNTMNGKVDAVTVGKPILIPAFGLRYGELQLPIEMTMELSIEGLGP